MVVVMVRVSGSSDSYGSGSTGISDTLPTKEGGMGFFVDCIFGRRKRN